MKLVSVHALIDRFINVSSMFAIITVDYVLNRQESIQIIIISKIVANVLFLISIA